MKFFPETFRKNLAHLLEVKKISQQDVAEYLQISPQAVSNWMNPEGTRPNEKNLERLALYLDVSVNDLIGSEMKSGSVVRDAETAYGTDKIILHLKRMNLHLEEIISDNNREIVRLTT